MSTASEMPGDTGYVEPVPASAETEFPFSGSRLFHEEGEIRPIDRGKHFIDELRTELALRDIVPVKDIFFDDSSDSRTSFEGDEVFEYVTVHPQIVELLAFIGIENELVVLCIERYELARYFESMGTDTVLEAVRIPDDPEKKERRDLDVYELSCPLYEVVHEFTGRTRLGIDQIIGTEHAIPVVMIDIDDRSVSENIGIEFSVFSYEVQISAIAHENRIEFFSDNLFGGIGMDVQKMEKRGDRKLVDRFNGFSDTPQVEIEGHTGAIRIAIDTPVSHDEEIPSFCHCFPDFSHFLLQFIHFYVF